MNQKPILFSTPMVQSINKNLKTQTRRIVPKKIVDAYYEYDDWCNSVIPNDIPTSRFYEKEYFLNKCSYKVGDIIWVRETCLWVLLDHAHDLLEGAKDRNQWVYKASVHNDWIKYAKSKYGYKWKPSIFMPKEATRIWLEITGIRVERLNDITENDAKAEGVINYGKQEYHPIWTAKKAFCELWESINGKQSWDDNPWVYVYDFKRIEKP